MYAEFTCLVGRRGHDAALCGISSDDDGFPFPFWMVKLLDRGEESIKVHEDDGCTIPGAQYVAMWFGLNHDTSVPVGPLGLLDCKGIAGWASSICANRSAGQLAFGSSRMLKVTGLALACQEE